MINSSSNNLKNKKGFTLIELIVVIAIIAILAAVLLPRFLGFSESARINSVISDTKNVLTAAEAMDAEGDLALTTDETEIMAYLGKDLGGTVEITALASGLSGVTLNYVKTVGPNEYTAAVEADGDITCGITPP